MPKTIILSLILGILVIGLSFQKSPNNKPPSEVLSNQIKSSHWLLLHRKSNLEYLYYGELGDSTNSKLLKTFKVKTGVPGEKPTPLPKLLNRDYWIITQKLESLENPETAPFFLTLNIPVTEEEPYGPTPYLECKGQCNWVLPGYFGLHGINGDQTRLSDQDPGSSGCIRHRDEDITYLYNLLDPEKEEIRYYIEDI